MKPLRVGVCTDAGVFNERTYTTALSTTDVVLLPELFDGGYAALNNGKPPHTPDDALYTSLRHASRRFNLTLVAGSNKYQRNTTHPTNTSLVFSKNKLVHRYDKIHLFGPTGDTHFFEGGKLLTRTFPLSVGKRTIRAGVIICYDLRFPELTRALSLRGMDILFVPARWPKARDDAWQFLLKARSIENQIFVVGCNSADSEGGYSYAFNPQGRLIFSNRAKRKQPLHSFEIHLDEIAEAKKLHRNLDEARFLRSLL